MKSTKVFVCAQELDLFLVTTTHGGIVERRYVLKDNAGLVQGSFMNKKELNRQLKAWNSD